MQITNQGNAPGDISGNPPENVSISNRAMIKDHFGESGITVFDALSQGVQEYNKKHGTNVQLNIELSFGTLTIILVNLPEHFSLSQLLDMLPDQAPDGYRIVTKRQDRSFKVELIGVPNPTAVMQTLGNDRRGIQITNHPFYDTQRLETAHQLNFLKGFDPRDVNTVHQTKGEELALQVKPLDPSLPFNAEQILLGSSYKISNGYYGALNMNADLGLQYTLREILRGNTITFKDQDGVEQPTFVILSHGHSIAGLAELSGMTRKNAKGQIEYLFDTSVYMPMVAWKPSSDNVRLKVASEGAQIWADKIERDKLRFQKDRILSAGGIAIALNGHRGDLKVAGEREYGTANIDPSQMLGPPEKFKKFLEARGLKRVVIVTEHYVKDPEKPNLLRLEDLQDSSGVSLSGVTFDDANKDLYDYMKTLQNLGVDVLVVSGEQRVIQ